MDPASILALVGTCLAITTKIASATSGLKDIISGLQSADQNISRLAAQLELFGSTVEELHTWLKGDPAVQPCLRQTIIKSLKWCSVVVSEIEGQVKKVAPRDGETKVRFAGKIRLLWNERALKKREDMIANQLQTFSLLLTLIQK
jgi:hypothetical protein